MLSLSISFFYISLLLFKVISAKIYRQRFDEKPCNIPMCDVSILQPILSGDPKLSQTLESNLSNLSGAVFFWLVDEEDHVGQDTVDTLIKRYKNEKIFIFSYPEAPEGVNPKLYKLHQALPLCETNHCIVLDDDTTLPQKTLQVLLAELRDYELVTGLPEYKEGGNFPSRLLAAFVNNNASNTFLSLLCHIDPITINGMCYGFKPAQLQSIGGFQPLLHCLTDDLAMAEHILSHGGKIRQVPYKQLIETSLSDTNHYISQMHRWYVFANILFFKQSLSIKFVIFTLYGLTPFLFISIFLATIVNITYLTFSCLVLTLIIRQLVLNGKPFKPSNIFTNMFISILSELVQSLHLAHSLFSKKIRWRSRHYRVISNKKFSSL